MRKYTIDRFEGELAVLLEKGNESIQKDVPKRYFPDDISEGDLVEEQQDGSFRYSVLKEETFEARNKAEALLEKLKNKHK
ncbi:DUF3006 domain-containing protein [Thalassobacillus pellis]|uniref:DUF3006 domain-containing protein n=1 Tax=Thalassobacillus pellis TaxID=748008 RepID=UPI0019600574|nr:DUF3006 domain-containing protein [Thalassobacillus pellis]MBM7551682.1 hypothetical protein [Thalassobacillus pellis]